MSEQTEQTSPQEGTGRVSMGRLLRRHWYVFVLVIPIAIGLALLIQYAYFQWVSHKYGLPEAGEFGDAFGTVTAFFTGVGFVGTAAVIFAQLEDLRRHQEEQVEARKTQTAATSMSIVNMLADRFNTSDMQNARRKASYSLLKSYKSDNWHRQLPDEEDLALRDVLNFLEDVAHFINHEHVDKDLVLSAFHMRMKMYFEFADNGFVGKAREDAEDNLLWIELEALCKDNGEIDTWNKKEHEQHHKTVSRKMYDDHNLEIRLQREHLRCGGYPWWQK